MFVRRDIEACAKAFARKCHRHNWPETNVGAGLPAKRRAGGARSQRRYKTQGRPNHAPPNPKTCTPVALPVSFPHNPATDIEKRRDWGDL
ncbi:hypothetical protein C5609_05105 [Pseudomonas putida]|nr:hypothetical protein C5609_05105 [Pseudomonas putida]